MSSTNDTIVLPDAPDLPGLTFRHFRGASDYPAMVNVLMGSKDADGIERADTVEDVVRNYAHLFNCDPYRDMIFAEVNGDVVGYGRVWWATDLEGNYLYPLLAFLLPEWRGKGIRRAMLHYNESRIREIAAEHPAEAPKFYEVWAGEGERHLNELIASEGYTPVRYFNEMVRPDLENLPDVPLPEGLEIRPVPPEHYRTVWDAAAEAFQDHWGASEWNDEGYNDWTSSPIFNPALWQVAWAGDQVAGMVLNFISVQENEAYDRKRGYTETICVRRPWRRMGLARALIAHSFHVLKAAGMTEAALGVDTQNLSGALQLYESMGFRKVKRSSTNRKPLA